MVEMISQAQLDTGDKILVTCYSCFRTHAYTFPYKVDMTIRYEFDLKCLSCQRKIKTSLQGLEPKKIERLGLIE